jgi:hypothetical protein
VEFRKRLLSQFTLKEILRILGRRWKIIFPSVQLASVKVLSQTKILEESKVYSEVEEVVALAS